MFQLRRDHTTQPPWESLLQGVAEEDPIDCRTLNSGEAVWFLSSCGTMEQIFTLAVSGGVRIWPSSLHVKFCLALCMCLIMLKSLVRLDILSQAFDAQDVTVKYLFCYL